jgi:predicted RNA-binding Zn-ribbon protein involved in translation (DUF1610 family)
MKQRYRGITTKRAICPNCGATVRWREQAGLKRFQVKLKRCDECNEVFR